MGNAESSSARNSGEEGEPSLGSLVVTFVVIIAIAVGARRLLSSLQQSPPLSSLQSLLGYRFKNPDLLAESLTHGSYVAAAANYQRLEFLGDAALGLALSNHLFRTNPTSPPGQLTLLRAANVSTEKLARAAVRHRLYPLLRRDAPHLDRAVQDFAKIVLAEDDSYSASSGSAVARAPKVLADIVESITGAVYVDSGFDLQRTWVAVRGILEPIVTVETLGEHPIMGLNELCQKLGKKRKFKYGLEKDLHVVTLFVGGRRMGSGSSKNKNLAESNAARDALPKLCEEVERLSGGKSGIVVEEDEREGKWKLFDLCVNNSWSRPEYKEIQEGSSEEKGFRCSVTVVANDGSEFMASGDYKSKLKEAKNDAACKLLKELIQAA